jgi:hypothetical protein
MFVALCSHVQFPTPTQTPTPTQNPTQTHMPPETSTNNPTQTAQPTKNNTTAGPFDANLIAAGLAIAVAVVVIGSLVKQKNKEHL